MIPLSSILALMLVIFISSAEVIIYINSSSPLASNTTSCGTVNAPCYTFDLGLDIAQERLMETHQLSITLMISQGEQYKHTSMTNGVFEEVNGLSIIGEVDNNGNILTTISCQGKVGFSFTNVSNITIYGINFEGCGQLQNSTSYTISNEDNGFLTFYVGLYFLYCQNVKLSAISVNNSSGTGVVLYNIKGNNVIENSKFTQNIFNDFNDTKLGGGGGGVYIEFSYCVPVEDGIDCLKGNTANVDPQYVTQSNFLIYGSIFCSNIANISNFASNTFILPGKQYHSAFGRGGGLSVFFKGDASYNTITVYNCSFICNKALWGAGIFVEFQDNVHNNNIIVNSSYILDNNLYYNNANNEGTGGGGSRVGYIFFDNSVPFSNKISFINCTFEGNNAYYGGGLSFYTARQPVVDNSSQLNAFKLQECYFLSNLARIGAALDLSLWHPSKSGNCPQPLLISNCIFENNSAMIQDGSGGLIGVGAVYVDSLPVNFSGNVSFNNNIGSALAVTGSYITIESISNVSFYNNSGRNGGAIALLSNVYILMNEDSMLRFVNNSAQYKGGAIYYFNAGERDLLSSRNCFIRYYNVSVQPEDWKSRFYFENNRIEGMTIDSNQYSAIYASTILPCIWGGAFGDSMYNKTTINRTFCWNENWHYEDTLSCSDQISSAPSNCKYIKSSYTTVPGKTFPLSLTIYDDLQNNLTDTAILVAWIKSGSATFRGDRNIKFDYILNKTLHFLHGKPNSIIQLQIETLDPIVVRQFIEVKLETCPPGFKPPNGTDDDSIFSCQCYDISAYKSYLQCNQDNYTSKLLRTAWMGYNSATEPKQFVVGETPYLSFDTHDHYVTLVNGSEQYLDQLFCSSSNRKGTLCGQCQDGYGVAVNSDNYHCVKCTEKEVQYSWVFYILTSYLPITIFFAIIFSMTVTFGPLNSFLFFAQIIATTVKVDADGMIPLQTLTNPVPYKVLKSLYVIPYDIWNLNFFRPYLGQFCLNSKLDTLGIMSLSYIEAFYPLILLVLFVIFMTLYNKGVPVIVCLCRPIHRCLARFRQWSKLRQSFTGGMAVFIVISYTKFTLVSLLILAPASLYDYSDKPVSQVHYYDGTVSFPCFKYIIPAIIILGTFGLILPLILAYPSLLKLLEHLSCGRLELGKFYPNLKFKAFLDEFHGCYKDGTNGELDCRWFASLYFLLRVSLFVVYAITESWKLQYLIQILLFLFAAFLFAVLRPYKKNWVNNVDVTIFLLLAAISCFSLYNLVFTWLGINIELWAFVLQYILIFIPLLYFIGYYLVLFCLKFKSYHKDLSRNRRIQGEQIQEQDEFHIDRGALVDSTHIPNFLDYMEDTRELGKHLRVSRSHSWHSRHPNRNSIRLRRSVSDERSPLLTGSLQFSTHNVIESEGSADDLHNENERNENTPYHPTEDQQSVHCTNNNQGGYGTSRSTLVSSAQPPL